MFHTLLRVSLVAALLFTSALPVSAQLAPELSHSGTEAQANAAIMIEEFELEGLFARATLPRAPNGGAYFSLTNSGPADDRLIGASTSIAGEVQIHSSTVEGDVMRMREVPDGVLLPAGETVTFEPSGLHLMLVGLNQPLVEGEAFLLTLQFEHAGAIEIEVPVAGIAAREAPDDGAERNGSSHQGH